MITQSYLSDALRLGAFGVVLLATGVIFIVVISPENFIGLLQHLAAAYVCTIPILYITLHIVSKRLVRNEHTI